MKKFYQENVEGCIKYEEIQPPPSKDGHEFVEITDTKKIESLYTDLYIVREEDGKRYFSTIRANLVQLYSVNELTELEIFGIEQILSPATRSLILGDWMTALYQLSLVTPVPPLAQELYDEINNYITNYIATNY